MKEGFRQSMAWLHTWSGLLVGWVLFLVFTAGTAAYYRDEITFWMKPELHQALGQPVPQAQALAHAVDLMQRRAPDSSRWFITLPTAREPTVRMFWSGPPQPPAAPGEKRRRQRFENAELDPASGQAASAARATRGGEFIYRLHFDLHYMPAIWARWIVGFCAMFMLVAIVSGIVTHKRIFKDFFTFRPKKGQRSWLDAHNATAVLALPYHLMITYTGLVTLMFMYMPWGPQAAYQDRGGIDSFFAEVFPSGGPRDAKASGQRAALAPLAPMLAQASAHWDGAAAGRVVVNHPNDAAATVSISRQEGRSMSQNQPSMLFDGVTGTLLSTAGDQTGPAAETRGVLYGLHIARFSNPLLRALFFLSGLAGCLMVATGLLLWAVKERQKYAKVVKHGGRIGFGLRLVDGLNLGTLAGVPIAFGAYFWANRLLPVGIDERAAAEIRWFFIAWGVAALAGLARPTRRMWQLQLGVGALLFAAIPLLNALTTRTHLGVSLREGLWSVAGFDLVSLALGLALAAAALLAGKPRPRAKAAAAGNAGLAS
ncbi:PepSY-associated TM helix domain-containing protein [Variovorax saccharolyticus]|uniref:PepSY-associated TM helix domain-containing protein n=1 Tax=Variovorax saccharolyticus TaxID=3053516 RepID=UPI002576C165|nr:PepSY-associated TM helix domain-containing protein [Variovorax sp. J31P216]MDM0028091.1 PepSY-associated TM helix domain-containing protein [Variovorax sp. J31P216]